MNRLRYFDIRGHFKQNKGKFICFAFSIIIGIIVGIMIVASSDSHLALLTSENKILYPYINGTAKSSEIFWVKFVGFVIPMVLIFLLNLNYFLGLISFVFVGYQVAVLVMSASALISLYGISGVLNFLLILLPINVIYIALTICFSVVCLERSKHAFERKQFSFNLQSEEFVLRIAVLFLMVLLLTVIATVIYPLFIKSAIFIIF